MKKLLFALTLVLSSGLASADLPDRIFEFGTQVDVGAGNSYITLGDVQKPTLVIDLKKMGQELPTDGFTLSADAQIALFTNLNLAKDLRFGLWFGTNGSGSGSVPKALFELLANGNGLDKTYTGTFKLRGDLDAELGAKFGTQLFGADVTFAGNFYIPLFHLDKPNATYSWRTNSDGTMTADVVAEVPVYSVAALDKPVTVSEVMDNLFRSGGLDLSASGDYPLFPDLLTVGASLRHIPLWPATLQIKSLVTSKYQFSMSDLANNLNSGKGTTTTESTTITSSKSKLAVLRPFHLGLHADYFPLGIPLIRLTPNLGLGVYQDVYPEVGLKATLDVWRWIVFQLGTQYEDQSWKQKVSLALNAWLMEIDLALGTQSPDLLKSFGGGLTASVGLKVGF